MKHYSVTVSKLNISNMHRLKYTTLLEANQNKVIELKSNPRKVDRLLN